MIMGKHIDKLVECRDEGVNTLPVLLGDKRARALAAAALIGQHVSVIALVAARKMPPGALLALAAARHALVAPVLRHREPAQGHAQPTRSRHHEARDRGGHLRAQRQVTPVDLEVIELVDDLLARLAREELGVLDHRRVDFLEAEARSDVAKVAEQPVASALVFGIEVARSARCLQGRLGHASGYHGSPGAAAG